MSAQESSFPQSLDYSPNPLAISARSYISQCVPESSSTAKPGEIVRIRIPSGRAGSYLNGHKSFLSFVVENKTSVDSLNTVGTVAEYSADANGLAYAGLRLDGSVYSIIQTQECYNSSNLLESIQNANVLYNIMVDLQTSTSNRLTSNTILGTGGTGNNSLYWTNWRAATLVPPIATEQQNSMNAIAGKEWINSINVYTGLNILSKPVAFVGGAPLEWTGGESIIITTQLGATGFPDVDLLEQGNQVGPVLGNLPVSYYNTGASTDPQVFANCQATYQRGASHHNGFISRAGPVIPYNGKCKFCVPLLSGVIGTLCCKLFPLHALNSDLQLHLTLASDNTAICNNYIPTHWDRASQAPDGGAIADGGTRVNGNNNLNPKYQLSEIQYHANIVEVSAQAQAMLDQATGGQYVIPSMSYRNFEYSLPSGSLVNEFPVPARFTSIRSMIGCQRPSDSLNRADRFSITSRIKNFMTGIQYRVGSLLVPQQPIKMENISASVGYVNSGKAPEAFCHLLECVGQSVTDMDIKCGLDDNMYGANHDIDYQYGARPDNFVASAAVPDRVITYGAPPSLANIVDGQTDQRYYARCTGSRAGFAWGIDMESFSNAGCTGPLQSGTNTLGLNLMCRLYCDNTKTNVGENVNPLTDIIPVQVSHFVCFDQVLVVSGGVCSSRF